MKKILVTTDFSANSKAGINFAIQMALQTQCELIFYHIFEGIENNSWNSTIKGSISQTKLEKLNHFIEKICNEKKISSKKISYVVEIGIDVNSMIINYAEKNKIDYICISTRGGGIIKKILGNTTNYLIKYSKTPIIVIPKRYRVKEISDIMYASDLSNLKKELHSVQNFAKELKANVHVYHYDYLLNVDSIKAKLDRIASKYTETGTDFTFRKMEIENTLSKHLYDDIKKSKCSLVILFTNQNKDWYERLFIRNNTAEFTFETKVPLLVLKKAK